MTRISTPRSIPAIVALLIAGWMLVLPPATGDAEAPASVRIKATYVDDGGDRHPLADVEVWILENYGIRRLMCTDVNGIALFEDVTADVIHTAGMGPSYNLPRCGNAAFLNPDDGRKMYAVVYPSNHGVLPLPGFEGFYPTAGALTKVPLAARTAKRQKKVCSGLRTTWVGTNDDDNWVGTSGIDVANGFGGEDSMDGGSGADYLCGGKGNDELIGNKQGDVLLGEEGKDSLYGDLGFDILDGGDGTRDRCRGELLFNCER